MKHALISPNEPRYTGVRIAQVSSSTFQVAAPLFWVDVADEVTAEKYFYNTQTQQAVQNPEPPTPEPLVAAPDQPSGTGLQQV